MIRRSLILAALLVSGAPVALADIAGANAAFRFSASFGAGSARDVDRSFCERSLADWRKLLQDHNLNR